MTAAAVSLTQYEDVHLNGLAKPLSRGLVFPYRSLRLGPGAARRFLLLLDQTESLALESQGRFVTKTG